MKTKVTLHLLFILLLLPFANFAQSTRSFYVVTAYHFTKPEQEVSLDTYLQTAYLPALHRKGKNNIGVFKPIANDTATDKLIYIIVPYSSLEEIIKLPQDVMNDDVYKTAAAGYLNASYQQPPYQRMENIILQAFPLAPQLTVPKLTSPKADHIYELRSYESPTEAYHINKVKMFNEGGEIGVFAKINANAVFYGDVISGCHMPNLMYLTSYENMADRDAHWKSFTDDPTSKKIFGMDEYKNNVSKADIILMHAASYSDY